MKEIESEKSFSRSFLKQLEQKQVYFSEEFIAPLSRLETVPYELDQPKMDLPEWKGMKKTENNDSEETVNITIKTLRGPKKTVNIKAQRSDTILCIKKNVSKALNIDLSQVRLLNKGKVLVDTKLVSDVLELGQTKIVLQTIIMEKMPVQETRFSSEAIETQNGTFQVNITYDTQVSHSNLHSIELDAAFWEDLKSFLLTKLDNNTCNTLYNIFKQAYVNTKT
ncbi:hypothetical protein PORY_002421 [Pneumocystis oryctolagi]|uniref:Uncharacterized protein n=1 Tax=Pneumocystis oryctolagi TaxID=42067 RepID=A0ACB7CB24_9ASCO|nr:hypothetical protein PORY_002421 [Pneumocystis oryctolagi]